jgi:DNA-binding transcriptional LysR family regulator
MLMTNDQAARLLRGIYDIAMSIRPGDDHNDIDSRYLMTFGLIAGAAHEALSAVQENRNLKRSQYSFPPREA